MKMYMKMMFLIALGLDYGFQNMCSNRKKSPQNPCLSMSLCVFFQFFLTASGSNALQEIIHFKKQYLCIDIGPLPFIVIFFLFLWPSQNI